MLEHSEQLERELTPEPLFKPAAGALLLHCALFAGVISYGLVHGLHRNVWGSNGSGAIQVSLVSSALPLPSDQPPNENVLATDKPSPAPAAPEPKAKQAVDEKAIPISGKQKAAKPEPKTVARVAPKQITPPQMNKAQYGEQAGSSTPHATAQGTSIGQTTINEGNFGALFGWYVDGINRKMAQSWLKGTVDSRTPKGTRVYLTFTIGRSGVPSDVKIDKSSGVPTLDRSCMMGVQRVDTFGPLPPAYNQSTLRVSYYCEY